MSDQGDEGCEQIKGVKELEGGVGHHKLAEGTILTPSLTRWDSHKGDCIYVITLNTVMVLPFITLSP